MVNSDKEKKSILIAEDESAMRKLLVDAFNKEDFKVIETKNGQEALTSALKKHPNFILLDINMPKMDGLTMLEELRQDEWGKTANVTILTNSEDQEKVARAMKNYTFEYLIKTNWKIEDIVKKIKEKLE